MINVVMVIVCVKMHWYCEMIEMVAGIPKQSWDITHGLPFSDYLLKHIASVRNDAESHGTLKAGTFDLVGIIVYEIDQLPYQNTFYTGGFGSVETVFLVSLGIALLAFVDARKQIGGLGWKALRGVALTAPLCDTIPSAFPD
ncbi:hypothetical protein Tco_1266266 [Tanacetum coccineum]